MVRPTGPGGVSDFFFQWSAQRPGGIRFSMVRPTGLRGFGFFFSMVRPTGLRGRGRVFQWSAQRAREGFRFFFNGPPNGPVVRPTGRRGFDFQWFAQRVSDGGKGGFFFQWSAQRVWWGFVFQWFAQRVWGEGGPVSFGVWWWCRRFFVSGQLPGL